MTTYSLSYIGDAPRRDERMHWCVTVQADQPLIAFYYFPTIEDAIRTYPALATQAIAILLDWTTKELTTFIAPSTDDQPSFDLILHRLHTCRELCAIA